MFNREYRDMGFLRRWSIVRKLREQTVAEHSYLVAMYANDFCSLFSLPENLRLRILQHALWHDVDEIFSADTPGPFKRAAVKDTRAWKDVLETLMQKVFGFNYRDGIGGHKGNEDSIVQAVVKAADWLEAACEMATEVQLGNANCEHHMYYDEQMAIETAQLAARLSSKYLPHNDVTMLVRVDDIVRDAVRACFRNVSEGPLTDDKERAIAVRMGRLPRD